MQAKIHPLKIISAYPKALKTRTYIYNNEITLINKSAEDYKRIWLKRYYDININSLFNRLTCKLFCKEEINEFERLKKLDARNFLIKILPINGFSSNDEDIELFQIRTAFFIRTINNKDCYDKDLKKMKLILTSAYHSQNECITFNC